MAYFMHLAIWPPKSSLTPNFEKMCDVTVECGGRVGAKSSANGHYTKILNFKSTFCLLIIYYPIIIGTLYMVFNITSQRRCLQVCPGCALQNSHS
jgi:hypothetical protein